MGKAQLGCLALLAALAATPALAAASAADARVKTVQGVTVHYGLAPAAKAPAAGVGERRVALDPGYRGVSFYRPRASDFQAGQPNVIHVSQPWRYIQKRRAKTSR
jgi:hypothetical protein